MEIETTYSVQYQKLGDDTWWEFTGQVFKGPVGRMHNETHDFDEAFAVARDLYDGKVHTDSRPRYQARVARTRITQQIYAGGIVMTFGEPLESKGGDDV
jgi:hypothetical protein